MTAWAVVALALAGSFLTAVLVGRRLAEAASALPVPAAAVAFSDPDEMAAMDRDGPRTGAAGSQHRAASLLSELRRRAQ